MRMDKDAPLSASDVVNSYTSSELEQILLEYGELRNNKKIASFIVQNRPFISAKELSEATKPLMPRGKKIHPATLLMQSIRIEVNDELGELNTLLQNLYDAKFQDTIVSIISFHSLEDRIVKQTFAKWAKRCICPQEIMRCACGNNNNIGKVLTKKPLIADKKELKENPRSRSAKMRNFKVIDNGR